MCIMCTPDIPVKKAINHIIRIYYQHVQCTKKISNILFFSNVLIPTIIELIITIIEHILSQHKFAQNASNSVDCFMKSHSDSDLTECVKLSNLDDEFILR